MGFFDIFSNKPSLTDFRDIIFKNTKNFDDGSLIKSWAYACVISTQDLLYSLFFNKDNSAHNPFNARADILDEKIISEIYKIFAIYSLSMFLYGNVTNFKTFDLPKERKKEIESEIASIFEFSAKNLSHYQSIKDNLEEKKIINELYDSIFREGLKITDFEDDLEILTFKVSAFPIFMTGCFIPMYNSLLTEFTQLK